MLPHTVKILETIDETREIKTFVLDASLPEAKPGQFVMLWLPEVDEKPISIAAPNVLLSNKNSPYRFTAKQVGRYA